MIAVRQDAQKPVRKFCAHKTAKNAKTHPEKPEKGETGCVLGAGEGCSRYGRVGNPEIRTKMHQIAMQHMKKGNRRKPSVFAGFLAGAEGLEPSARGFGVDVERVDRERRRAGVDRFFGQGTKRRCWFGAFRFSRSKTRNESPLEISQNEFAKNTAISAHTRRSETRCRLFQNGHHRRACGPLPGWS